MSSRLQLKHGLVAERDRLSTSADSMLVTEPSTGSKSRSKGNLYVLVSSATVGGRARDAAAVVAQTIQREYYYDESAGIPMVLEKCFRSANRKLRGRDGSGLQPGALGIAVAVVRGNELYVATVGSVDAYLVRAARLLVPEHTATEGIPAQELRVDVWRGELSIGDSILLVSRKLTEAVGTEELKNAVVTLHPQSAVEHLHHLFVASGGEGSDAVLVVEASDLAGRSNGSKPGLPAGGDAFGELAAGSQAEVVGAARSQGGPPGAGVVAAVTGAFGDAVDRVMDLLPRRRASTKRITPQVNRREAQRRGAIAILAFLAVILIGGVAVAFFPRLQEQTPSQVSNAEAAYNSARDKTEEALGPGGVPQVDNARATTLLRGAWADLKRAEAGGVAAQPVADLRSRITAGLDFLYDVRHARATTVVAFGATAKPLALEHGPTSDPDGLYYIDDAKGTVSRVDATASNPKPVVVVTTGDGSGQGISRPRFLAAGGLDLLIVDARGNLWSWRPSDTKGNGHLQSIPIGGDQVWGSNVTDVATYPSNSTKYGLYVVLPTASQILKYTQFADGTALSAPSNWLTRTTEDVSQFLDMTINFSMYTITAKEGSCTEACVGDTVIEHQTGNLQDSWKLDAAPDDADLRPGHDYRWIVNTGGANDGNLYVYDASHDRLMVFDKSGGYREQWSSVPSSVAMDGVVGILVVPPPAATPDAPTTFYWLSPHGLMKSALTDIPVGPNETPLPSASPQPSNAEPSPTCKPKKCPTPAP